ncbi:MAG: hypothetical protein M1819_000893 [Sarea resinae]|nr:MAG: hypothetical protein M1819_000893 [Sarea resinae]
MPSPPPPTTSPSPRPSPLLPSAELEAPTVSATSTAESHSRSPTHISVSSLASQQDGRRTSIQFAPHASGTQRPSGVPKRAPSNRQRRMSSPPPPATCYLAGSAFMSLEAFKVFRPRVSFDTFDNRDATDFSLTLNCKHRDYQYTRRSRTFLCGTDSNDYSEFALEWLIDELVDDGDEIVCLRVVEKDSKITSDASVEEGRYRKEAHKFLDRIIDKNSDEKAINLVLEFAVGKVHDTIQRMIQIYEPAILVVGTRGRSLGGFQGLLPGSVSKYCLQHSPVPVIVVRPTYKRERKKQKRLADPTRRGYMDILEKSGAKGGHILDRSHINSLVDDAPLAADGEAAAVAAAIGISAAGLTPLSKVESARSDKTDKTDKTDATAPELEGVVMKSPELQNLESPPISNASDDEEEGDENQFEAVPGHLLVSEEKHGEDGEDGEGQTDEANPLPHSDIPIPTVIEPAADSEPEKGEAEEKDDKGT